MSRRYSKHTLGDEEVLDVDGREYTSLAFLLPISTLVGYVIGYLLDKAFGTHFLYVIFLVLGTISGFVQPIRQGDAGYRATMDLDRAVGRIVRLDSGPDSSRHSSLFRQSRMAWRLRIPARRTDFVLEFPLDQAHRLRLGRCGRREAAAGKSSRLPGASLSAARDSSAYVIG